MSRCCGTNRLVTDNKPVVMITGANAGIGRATAHGLAQRGAAVIMACRNMTAAKTAAQDICRTTGNDAVRCVEIDLADLASVQRCAANVAADGVDVLINNAGGAFPTRGFTAQGFEQTFGVNYLGPYALTRVLLPHMSGAPRVINVSSLGHRYCRGVGVSPVKLATCMPDTIIPGVLPPKTVNRPKY